jgi:hypothetical protein
MFPRAVVSCRTENNNHWSFLKRRVRILLKIVGFYTYRGITYLPRAMAEAQIWFPGKSMLSYRNKTISLPFFSPRATMILIFTVVLRDAPI